MNKAGAAAQKKTAITPTRDEDYSEWFQQVVKAADLAENAPVRGCMTMKPWGYGIWEKVQADLDRRIKAHGHENVAFPLFIPLSFFQREADHVEGFAKECAVVTHHRLEERDGKLAPAGELEEPYIVRPTSETIIGEAFSRWIDSHRDLPVLINQWCNVVRWEMRTRMFLRTSEFFWQEGHTAHATPEEAQEHTIRMLNNYRDFLQETMALPPIAGEKSPGERFPGADHTYTVELMMQDRKALQAGTSHNLGQNFAKAQNIRYNAADGALNYCYTTSWGASTRMVGGLIMTHSDDDGLRIPPRVAPKHVVIIPIIPKPELEERVLAYAEDLKQQLQTRPFYHGTVDVVVDKREIRGGEKTWQWIKRGIPLRVEVGPRDLEAGVAMVARRDRDHKQKEKIGKDALGDYVVKTLEEMQQGYLAEAKAFRDSHIVDNITDFEGLKQFFAPKNADKPEIHGGFVRAKWCGDPETEQLLDPLKVTIRCLPEDQSGTEGTCILTGKPATLDVILAKSY